MTTLDAIQRLSDGMFHRLCDDVLRRIEGRYKRLRPHGINDRGESIVGKPDSYVGETAATCDIAFCYSVERRGWWNKAIRDVQETVAACSSVKEIVFATARNVDREGPQDKRIDWLGKATAAAGAATLRTVDGRELALYLDEDHQDLRYEHLRIPYSRLSEQSIQISCRESNEQTIAALRSSGRYDPQRYTPRAADASFSPSGSKALHRKSSGASGTDPVRLIALINDSGVGKTSLLSSFVQSVSSVLPAILLEARNIAFASEDALVNHVIHALQGVLDPQARVGEEAAISHHLARDRPLTVVLDGLDESNDPASVRRVISYWLNSKLGKVSLLVVSARPEFWLRCMDPGWRRSLPQSRPDDHAAGIPLGRSPVERHDPLRGNRLPDRFTQHELEGAWEHGGQAPERLFAPSNRFREELRHPFTLRIYLDLISGPGAAVAVSTRSELMGLWLDRRLEAEATRGGQRLSKEILQTALRIIATRIAESGDASSAVDALSGVPRFDATHPPGPVVEQLLNANILETLPGAPDRIRFAIEAVQDFYRAEADVADIVTAPEHMAERLSQSLFSDIAPRLTRIGQLLATQEVRHRFVDCLAGFDVHMAAVVLQSATTQYTPEVRQRVTADLAREITNRYRVRAAFALEMLSTLPCAESQGCLTTHLLPPAEPHFALKTVGGIACIRLGYIPGIPIAYQWPHFGIRRDRTAYYFKDVLGLVRNADSDFKAAFAEYA